MSQSTLRVLALVPYPLGRAPGQRYRIEQWAPYLHEEGIELHFEPFADEFLAEVLYERGAYLRKTWAMGRAFLRRLGVVRRSSGFDAVYLSREAALVGPAWFERVVRRQNPRLVYDFDDAVWLPYVSPTNRYLSYLKMPGKTRTICRLAAAVMVGNETLAEYAHRHNPNVSVVPSTVSLREYRLRPALREGGPPVVGWMGSHSSAQYLSTIEAPLRELGRRRPYRLLIVGVAGYHLDGVDVECRPWRPETEVDCLWEMDIGLMPLADDPWARGKCAMKAIQYMGVGLPAVVSPVGANRTVVTDGVTGLHARTTAEWVAALERLLSNPQLRRRLGKEAHLRVAREYSAEVHAPRVAALIRSLQP